MATTDLRSRSGDAARAARAAPALSLRSAAAAAGVHEDVLEAELAGFSGRGRCDKLAAAAANTAVVRSCTHGISREQPTRSA